MVELAISYGHDTDTTAAIAGGGLAVPGAVFAADDIAAPLLPGGTVEQAVLEASVSKATFTGLAVGGMVVGSPGMEQGSMKQPYNVTAFTRGGKSTVYARR